MENEILQQILSELKDLKEGQNKLEQGYVKLEQGQAKLVSDMAEVKQDVAELKIDVVELKIDMAEVKQDVSNIKIKLENETNKHVRLIAEGHVDIIRRLDYIQPIVENLEDDVAVIKSVVTDQSKEINVLKNAL